MNRPQVIKGALKFKSSNPTHKKSTAVTEPPKLEQVKEPES